MSEAITTLGQQLHGAGRIQSAEEFTRAHPGTVLPPGTQRVYNPHGTRLECLQSSFAAHRTIAAAVNDVPIEGNVAKIRDDYAKTSAATIAAVKKNVRESRNFKGDDQLSNVHLMRLTDPKNGPNDPSDMPEILAGSYINNMGVTVAGLDGQIKAFVAPLGCSANSPGVLLMHTGDHYVLPIGPASDFMCRIPAKLSSTAAVHAILKDAAEQGQTLTESAINGPAAQQQQSSSPQSISSGSSDAPEPRTAARQQRPRPAAQQQQPRRAARQQQPPAAHNTSSTDPDDDDDDGGGDNGSGRSGRRDRNAGRGRGDRDDGRSNRGRSSRASRSPSVSFAAPAVTNPGAATPPTTAPARATRSRAAQRI
jgi:hypothetical protein